MMGSLFGQILPSAAARNPGIPSHPKQGTLHKEPLAATHQSHRKKGERRFRPASAVRLSAQARFSRRENLLRAGDR